MTEPTPDILTNHAPAAPAATVVPDGVRSVGPPRSRQRVLAAVSGAVGAVLVTTAGIALGMALAAGGTQPEDVLPAGAAAYVDVDFDPSVGQKVAAVRFFHALPDEQGSLSSVSDLRSGLVEMLLGRSDVDVARQVEPWLGDRAGVALLVNDGDLVPVLAVQTSDPAVARSQLARLLPGQGTSVVGDYVLVAPTQELADLTARAGEARPLSEDPTFAQAFDGLGDGVASVFADGRRLAAVTASSGRTPSLLGSAPGLEPLAAAGPVAGVVKFEPNAVDLVAHVAGTAQSAPSGGVGLVTGLPDSTVLALGSTGGTEQLRAQTTQLLHALTQATGRSSTAQLRSRYGLRLPQDLETLLGSQRVLAVGGRPSALGLPDAGFRSVTDPEAAADLAGRLGPLVQQVTGGFGLVTLPTNDGLVVATSPGYASQLQRSDGTLGRSSAFRAAVPGAEQATAVGYVDLRSARSLIATLVPGGQVPSIPFRAVGFSLSASGAQQQLQVRLTLD